MSEQGKEIITEGILLEDAKRVLQEEIVKIAIVEELEKIKAEADEQIKYVIQYKGDKDYDFGSYDAYNCIYEIINNHIAELKGETNGRE